MALAAAGRANDAERMVESMERYAAESGETEAMRSWARGNPYLPFVFESRLASGDVRNMILP